MQREALTDLDRDRTRQGAEAGEIRARRVQRAESEATAFVGDQQKKRERLL